MKCLPTNPTLRGGAFWGLTYASLRQAALARCLFLSLPRSFSLDLDLSLSFSQLRRLNKPPARKDCCNKRKQYAM